eukprot:TRINITY_DN74771_c0_g1_i1.p1 TRINITY_DN74771_c0_g1~~TRINITY_DN74771_c0_g1_i1.p1  ORF type:complete len:509 (-),score=101.54 TRINITY_DN74771_c0_g1_i1:105-1457(-)
MAASDEKPAATTVAQSENKDTTPATPSVAEGIVAAETARVLTALAPAPAAGGAACAPREEAGAAVAVPPTIPAQPEVLGNMVQKGTHTGPFPPGKIVEVPPKSSAEADALQMKLVRLCVRNLSRDVVHVQLRSLFEPYGAVLSAQVRTNKDGRSRGFGFLVMPEAAAEKALKEINGRVVWGKAVDVQVLARHVVTTRALAAVPDKTIPVKLGESPVVEAAALATATLFGKEAGAAARKCGGGGDANGAKTTGKGKGRRDRKGQLTKVAANVEEDKGNVEALGPQVQSLFPWQSKIMSGASPLPLTPLQLSVFNSAGWPYGYNPYAYNIALQQAIAHQAAALAAAANAAAQAKERGPVSFPKQVPARRIYEGSLKSLSARHGYGFIVCAETFAIFHRDIYVEQRDLPAGAKIRARIQFSISLSDKGHPRATQTKLVSISSPCGNAACSSTH